MSIIKPFTIDVPQAKLDDLRERLGRTIWPSTIEGQSYGGPALAQMQELARRAATFDWRKQEAEINELPHFITEIDGQTSTSSTSSRRSRARCRCCSSTAGPARWSSSWTTSDR